MLIRTKNFAHLRMKYIGQGLLAFVATRRRIDGTEKAHK